MVVLSLVCGSNDPHENRTTLYVQMHLRHSPLSLTHPPLTHKHTPWIPHTRALPNPICLQYPRSIITI